MRAHQLADRDDNPVEEKIVLLRNATWADYQRHLEIRCDRPVPRFAYLEVLEITSPSQSHESLKAWIGCLIEVWCLEKGIEFSPYGSWTLESKEAQRGVEPDECYVFGTDPVVKRRPDLAIEVVWTSGGLDKLDIYRKLGGREVWLSRRGRLTVHALRGEVYQELAASEVLPGIDLDELTAYLARPTASQAIRDYRARVRERG